MQLDRTPHQYITKPMALEIIISGTAKTVSRQELFDLAANGTVGPRTPVSVDGKLVTADRIKGITFDTIPSDVVELIDDAPSVLPKPMAITSPSHNIASGIKERCGHWGGVFTALGFAIPFICGLIAGFNPESGPSLFVFWAGIVFGGFFLTVGPVLVIGPSGIAKQKTNLPPCGPLV